MQSLDANASSLPVEFHGHAGEYFGIWMVNVCLTVLTLGLYAPWAKVRQKRYFYGSTHVAGASFDYLANPAAILKGRLIALVIVLVLGTIAKFQPLLEPFLWVGFFVMLPWLIIRSHKFNALNTVYRNIHFNFDAPYSTCFLNFVALPVFILPLSLGLAYPWIVRRQKTFLVNHNAYGNQSFALDVTTKAIVSIFLRLGLFGIAIFTACTLALLTAFNMQIASPPPIMQALLLIGMLPLFLFATVYMDVAMTNLIWNNARIGNINFRCELKFTRMLYIY
jgi:uncharacterized membrane protein YjgN (DUF898 family)